jgi:hypothetical protein
MNITGDGDENVHNWGQHGNLNEEVLSSFSSPCYGVKTVYNYGLW